MKRNLLFAVAGLALLVGLAVATRPRPGRAQDRFGPPAQEAPAQAAAAQPPAGPEINRDIEVSPQQGPWMISIASYTGKDSPRMARDLALVLRGPRYNLPAYVFNHGVEQQQREEARGQAFLEQRNQYIERMRAQFGPDVEVGRFPRLSTQVHTHIQVAVLVGGYPDMDAAHRELERIRLLPVEGLRGLKLDQLTFLDLQEKCGEGRTVSPFKMAFVVHNPTVRQERPAAANQLDLAALRRLNSDEDYSLLECRKPLTLVVAQYWLPAPLKKDRAAQPSLLSKVGLGKRQNDADPAAVPAHSVAEWLRKSCKLEAYVLHTENTSIVTVGGYDGLQDPRLRQMKERWVAANFRQDPRFQMLNLFPEPLPMQVPH